METVLNNHKSKLAKVSGRRRMHAVMGALEGRTLFAVTVNNPIADVGVRPSAPVGTIPLTGVFATNNLDNVTGTVVRMPVSFGLGANAFSSSITFALFDQATPLTVQNFLNYVTAGKYTNTIIHRTTSLDADHLAVIQGGGFNYDDTAGFDTIATNSPVVNEFTNSPRNASGKVNTRGTVAMAKTSDPNSATDQWFINTADNSTALDNTSNSGGFTTFGTVIGGMDVADKINALPVYNGSSINSAFSALPLADYNTSQQLQPGNIVRFSSASVIANPKTFLSYTASSSNSALVTAGVDANNNVTLTYAPNKFGAATISVTATDLAGASVTDTFSVNVARPILAVTYSGSTVANLQSKVLALGFAFTDQSATRTFVLKNTGTGILDLGTITLPTGLSVATAPAATLAAGATTTLVLQLDTAAESTIAGNVIIGHDGENAISGGFSFPVSASVGSGITLGANGVKSVTYTDADGSVGVFSYAGPGTAKVTFTGTDLAADSGKTTVKVTGTTVAVSTIVLAGSTTASSLTASISKGTDKLVLIDSVSSPTAVKAVTLKGVVVRTSVALAGGVSTLTLGKLDSATVDVPGPVAAFTPGDVVDSTLTFTGAVKSLVLGVVSGSHLSVAGAVTSATAKSISDSTVTFSGGVATLAVAADLSSSSVDIAGTAKKITAAQVLDSDLSADVLTSFSVTGKPADSFSGSTLNAGTAGTLSLGQLTLNGALSSVLANSIAVLSGRPAIGKAFSLKKITSATDITALLTAAGVPDTRLDVSVS